jgi:hypothetical protein
VRRRGVGKNNQLHSNVGIRFTRGINSGIVIGKLCIVNRK